MCEINVNNFIKLRLAHNLSINKMSSLLGFKWASSIANIEKGRATFSVDTLITVSNYFGVSIDWLLGRSTTPYTDESITLAENILIKEINIADKRNGFSFEKSVPLYYSTMESRKENYSLAIRANIVYLMYVSYVAYIKEFNNLADIKEGENPIKKLALKSLMKDPNYNWQSPEQVVFSGLLSELLYKNITTPVFDITKEVA